jgi:integrase
MKRLPYILYQRKQGGKKGKVYYVAFWDAAGRVYKVRRSTGETSRALADREARKLLNEGVPLTSGTTFSDYLTAFWAAGGEYARAKLARGRKLSAAYQANSRGAVKKWVVPWLDDKHPRLILEHVTAGICEGLLMYLNGAGMSARRANSIYQAVTVALSEAHRLGRIRENPARKVPRLAETHARREILTPAEARSFFALPWAEPRFLAINLLAATTGLRMGECLGLRDECVHSDSAGDWIDVRGNWQAGEGMKAPKWGSARTVPCPKKTVELLRSLLNPWADGFIFAGDRVGRPLSKRKVENAFNAAIIAMRITEEERRRRGLTFHSWRHWYRSMLDGAGLSARAGDALTGHREEATGTRYTHITEDQKKAVASLGSDLLEPQLGGGRKSPAF